MQDLSFSLRAFQNESVTNKALHVTHDTSPELNCVDSTDLCLTQQVVLRSINSSKSAYASVSFQSNFFDEYNVFERNIVQAGVLMKVDHIQTLAPT